jgi:ribonuclease HII
VLVLGVDENGLGPLLGPLVTTAVALELGRYQVARLSTLGRELGIDDSKATAAFGRMALAESLALGALESLHGAAPGDAETLLGSLSLDAPTSLRAPCPEASLPQCWSAAITLPCFGGDVVSGRRALGALATRGVRLVRVKSALACTRVLNDRLARGQSRVEVDLELMERLVLDARAAHTGDIHAVCGMVGGIRNYVEKLRHIARDKVRARRATLGTLAFDMEGIGHVRFEIDADQRHLPVALASMIGKYVRELWMLRHNSFYRRFDANLLEVSGYHDPVTRRFIAETALLRKRLGVEDACFARDSAKQLEDKRQLALFDAAP